MANIKQIVSAQLSQRQREINQQADRAALLDPDRLLCNIVRVDGDINVPSRPGFVWCQEYSPSDDTNPFHAFNDKVQAREGLTVWIAAGLGGRREVLDWNNATIVNTSDYAGQKYLPLHRADHEWPDFKPGPDAVNVYPRSLSMLRTYPGEAGALTVSASPLRYIKGNALVVFPGKNSLDISASQPASGLARFVGIYLDPDDNTLKSVNGAATGDSPAITPDSPAFPESAILSANVRLNGDQTVFSEIDHVDVRQILDASGAIDGVRVSKLVSPDGLTDPVVNANNSGDVGIGTTGQDARLDVLDTGGAQLRLTFEDGVKFADFTLDTNHDLTIKPSSTGQIIFQPTTDSIDFFQVLDADGGTPVLNVDSTNERVGIGTASPDRQFHIEKAGAVTARLQNTTVANSHFSLIDLQSTQAQIQKTSASGNALIDINPLPSDNLGNAQFRFFRTTDTVGTVAFILFRGNNTAAVHAQIGVNGADSYLAVPTAGLVAIGSIVPAAKLDVDQAGSSEAIPVLLLDQADVDEPFTKYVGSAAAATLTRSLVAEADVTTATRIGWRKIEIDDVGNQITDGDYYEPFYSLA